MEKAYRLRHQVFVEEMGWRTLAKPDGREIDQFDTAHAVHMLYSEEGEVYGYQRLLPSTRPHLLSDVMPQLCEVEGPVGAHIWEWARLCIERSRREQGGEMCPVGVQLITAALEWGLEHGVSQFIIETDPSWLPRMLEFHFSVNPLGQPQTIDGKTFIALTLAIEGRTLECLREMRSASSTLVR